MIELESPPQSSSSRVSPAYRWWMRKAEDLLHPLVGLMRPGAAELPMEGQVSNHGVQADRLETFARPCLWASHWLAAEAVGDEALSREAVAEWLRQGLVAGVNPSSPAYWGPSANYHQHTVEMGALVLALEKASEWLWEPLSARERAMVADWMGSVRGVGLHRNNHMFFGVLPLCFLDRHGYGRSGDKRCVMRWMDIMESMHLGGGWFIDGMNETVDHYNAYAFHYYGLWWGLLYGDLDWARAQRWQEWTRDFLPDYAHFFAASGEPVPFGRSLTYRFAATAPFALAEKCGISPLDPGLSRRICTQGLRFFVEKQISQSQGVLNLGWTDEFPAITEAYSCAGSTYWAAKGLSPLLLSPEHPFWTAEEKPMPAEQGDFSLSIPQIGMVVRSHAGEVEMLNAATSIAGCNTAFGTHKWGRLSFRTGVGWEVKRPDGFQPLDSALTAEGRDGAIFGRQATHPLDVEDDHIASLYALGDRFSQFNVQAESHIWWRGGWQLHLHRCRAWQPARLMLGGYSLAATEVSELREGGSFPFVSATNSESTVALQSLGGFANVGRRFTPGTSKERVHICGPNSLSLYLRTEWTDGPCDLLALSYTGSGSECPEAWEIAHSHAGLLELRNATGEIWHIEHESLPALEVSDV
jgi:hypothetical protein